MKVDFKPAYEGSFPDSIQFKKRFDVWPLQISAKVTWALDSGELLQRISVKDKWIRGKFTANMADNSLEYKKRFTLPLVRLPLGAICAGVRWSPDPETRCLLPRFRLGVELRQGADMLGSLHTVQLRPKVMLTRHVGVQMVGRASASLPNKLGLDFALTDGVAVDPETIGIKLDVEKLNIVFHL